MWPSNTEVKNTLCKTGVILFRDSHLQLNPNLNLAKTLLDKELLISALDASNALFDQEEKLKLAVLLRDYIYSCSDLDELHLNIQNFWKDYFQFSKSFLVEVPIISFFLLIIFSPIWLSMRWLSLKLDIWSTEKRRIKQTNNLSSGIKEAKNQSNLINPLTIKHDPKLYEIPEQKQSVVSNLAVEMLIENLTEVISKLSKELFEQLLKIDIDDEDDAADELKIQLFKIQLNELLEKHIGDNSSYELKNLLKNGLEIIYYHLNDDLDQKHNDDKSATVNKLLEGIHACSAGFHNRVNTLLESFNGVENFSELLYLVRKSLIEKTALAQMQFNVFNSGNEIHTYNDFTRIAHQIGLGVPFGTDAYRGNMNWRDIRKALQTEFANNYTLFNLPTFLTENLQGLLIKAGYTGAKALDQSYIVGTDDSEVEKMTQFIKKFLSTDFQSIDWKDFFIIDKETDNILDVNWKFIKNLFLEQLTSENYFEACSDEDFNQHLSDLLNYIKTTGNNYFTLLAKIEPKSFKTLFHRLQKTQSKELQEKVINLLFERDETGLTPLQIVAQNNPEILKRLLGFIDSDPCCQAIIQTLFIKQSDLIRDSFVCVSQNQPQSAFILLNHIVQHPEIFKHYRPGNGLSSENLTHIQHGLLNLMTKRDSDINQETTVLRFLSSFANALPQPSNEVIDFLFIALSHIDDKPLITNIISQYSALLLKNFSIRYFKDQNKNLAFITEKLLEAYADELIERSNTHVKYTTQFFNYPFGYSTSEKLTALTVIKDILSNESNSEKIEQLQKAKSAYPSLRNGRLSHLFKACTQDIAVTSHIKFQLHN